MMKKELIIKATLLSYLAARALIITEQMLAAQRNVILADLKQFVKITKTKPHYNKTYSKGSY